MPPSLTPFTLTDALKAIGVAQVFIGDPLLVPGTAGALAVIGATEGPINFNPAFEYNPLTAPEITGGVNHQSTTTLGNVTISVPVILGDPTLYAKITPTKTVGGGFSFPQKVQETSCLIIPLAELGGGLAYNVSGTQWARTAGNGVAAATGAGAAPQAAIWLWRCYISHGELPYSYTNGGKVIATLTITGMYDATKPEGHKVYTIGDPYAAKNELTQVAAPINVVPDA